jgi:hypothetical protein
MGNNPDTANGPDRRMTGEASDTVERDLRVLIADERSKRLAVVAGILTKLGHVLTAAVEVIPRRLNDEATGTRGLCS